MTMAPTETELVAAAVAALMKDAARGIFQLTGSRDLSYFNIGCYLADRLGANRALVKESNTTDAGLPIGSARPHTTLQLIRDCATCTDLQPQMSSRSWIQLLLHRCNETSPQRSGCRRSTHFVRMTLGKIRILNMASERSQVAGVDLLAK